MTSNIGPVFVSYAHQGAGREYLSLCEETVRIAGLNIDIWTDQKIQAGDDWQREIESALEQASAAVLLIDWKFLNSRYVADKELPALLSAAAGLSVAVGGEALASSIPIIPILVESCPYEIKWPWLNSLQLEPEHSLRDRMDPRKEEFKDLLTLDELSEPHIAKFKTALTKRLGTNVRPRVVAVPAAEAANGPLDREQAYSRYLTKGEDLSGNYVDLQLNLTHTELETYRLEVRHGFKDGSESHSDSWYGLVSLRREDLAATTRETGEGVAHPGQPIVQAALCDAQRPAIHTTNVSACIARARSKADELGVPLQLHVGINANAGELHEIPWETLPLDDGAPAAQTERILFSRTSLSAGDDAVECQTRALDALRVLSVFSDVGIAPTDGDDPQQHGAILGSMESSVKALATDDQGSKSLLRPDPDVLLEHLSISASYDVLYLACEAVKRDNEYYLQLPKRDLSQAELARHFRRAPIPRLVIMVPAHQLAGGPENRDSVRALAHFAPMFSRLGAAGVLTCQRAMAPEAWTGFLQTFFAALDQHGHVSGAAAEARKASLGADNWWQPVLVSRVKASRLWYKPGFVSNERPEANWESLLSSLWNDRFCPVIGPGILYRLQQTRVELAREMADEYDFPLSFSHRINLSTVAQYVRTLEPNKNVFLAKLEKKIRERLLSIVGIPATAAGRSLRDLAYHVAVEVLKAEPNNPYNVLARLPVGLYLTTNLDPFLEAALDLAKTNTHRAVSPPIEEVHVFDFAKVDPERPDFTGATVLPRSEFDAGHPILVQLYGSYEQLGSAAIAEDDYFQFLATFCQRMKDVKGPLEGKLGTSDLVFLGFKWSSLDFRVLFRALQKYANTMPEESFHIAVQIDPDDDETIHPDKALEYLRRYFAGGKHLQRARISLFWGSTGDFLQELEARL